MRRRVTGLMLLVVAGATNAADVDAGRNTFRQQCALCHTAEAGDAGGAQGPDLAGVFERPAASAAGFAYTDALRNTKLTWDAATLERFLAGPTSVVPGSAMVIPVPQAADRENLIAYFRSLKQSTPASAAKPAPAMQPVAGIQAGGADWKLDKPGRVHRITAGKLPGPFATPAVRNFPRLVPRPPGAQLQVPPGFKVSVFTRGLEGPRVMRAAPNGDVFVAESRSGRITVLRPNADNSEVALTEVFAKGLTQPFGLQFYPAGGEPQWLYVAEINRVLRYRYRNGDVVAGASPEVVVAELAPSISGHVTRDLAFSPDGKRMFVSVGSQSNVADDLPKKSAAQLKQWEAQYGTGAAWGDEAKRATVQVFEVGVNRPGKIFATGLRNCVGLTVQPANGELWCAVNERDRLGNDLVPDYVTRVQEGGFYGWPWYYMGDNEDPRHKGARPDLADRVIVPDVLLTSHSAALNITFYTATAGRSAFPKDYVGDAFAVLHGSWNREFRTGHKVVRVRIKNNVPTGEYEDFLTGFIVDDGFAWGRPVAAEVLNDGSLLVSEDGNNVIYRVTYAAPAG
jgi:glucose/arabinose dehydrogenase/cytochrome c2